MSKKLAIIVPGIGYTKDKPLLYYSTRLMKELGYDVIHIAFSDMPENIFADDEKKLQAVMIASGQMTEQLSDIEYDQYEDVVFIGKSLGTVVAAKYVRDNNLTVRQIWFTPVEKTFSFDSKEVLAFIGDADPWSDFETIKSQAKRLDITLHTYEGLNHSLEGKNVADNIKTILSVIEICERYIKNV